MWIKTNIKIYFGFIRLIINNLIFKFSINYCYIAIHLRLKYSGQIGTVMKLFIYLIIFYGIIHIIGILQCKMDLFFKFWGLSNHRFIHKFILLKM